MHTGDGETAVWLTTPDEINGALRAAEEIELHITRYDPALRASRSRPVATLSDSHHPEIFRLLQQGVAIQTYRDGLKLMTLGRLFIRSRGRLYVVAYDPGSGILLGNAWNWGHVPSEVRAGLQQLSSCQA